MHPYATDSNERKLIPVILVIVSVLFALLLNRILNTLQYFPPWWIDVPSFVGFYGLFYMIFDKYLWRASFFRTIRLIKVPDLNGIWKGHLTSSFTSNAKKYNVTIKINQSWTKISINMGTQYSKSRSLTASLLVEYFDEIILSYEYLNEPLPNARSSMNIHRGATRLTLLSGHQELDGDYYSGRGRQNFGALYVKQG